MKSKDIDQAREVILTALGLLMDRNLEWSGDFRNIKPILCVVLHDNLVNSKPNKNIIATHRKNCTTLFLFIFIYLRSFIAFSMTRSLGLPTTYQRLCQ